MHGFAITKNFPGKDVNKFQNEEIEGILIGSFERGEFLLKYKWNIIALYSESIERKALLGFIGR